MFNWVKRLFQKNEPVEINDDYSLEELETLLLGSKVARKKQGFVDRQQFLSEQADPVRPRLPPGQRLTEGLPILDLGRRPDIKADQWALTLSGLVRTELILSWADFQNLKKTSYVHDIHCVTSWSSFDQAWEGVGTEEIMNLADVDQRAKFVMIESHDGYSTNLTIADFSMPGTLVADHWNGEALTKEHGGPARLVIPHLYFWKSAKWIRKITFLENEERGLWEKNGYHVRGDPWKQQRYRAQEIYE